MKEALRHQVLYIGMDDSKLILDVSCLSQGGTQLYQQFENSKTGLQSLHRWLLQQPGFSYATALFCLEHTGLYSRQVVAFLLLKSGRVLLESSLYLKRSMGLVRGKNDKIDSLRIARYALTNHQ